MIDFTPPEFYDGDNAKDLLKSLEGSRFILSTKPFYAWLICSGFCDVYNSSKDTYFRGEVYIHSARKFSVFDYGHAYQFTQSVNPDAAVAIPDYKTLMRNFSGGIIGKAIITGVYMPCTGEFSSFWHLPNRYAYKMEKPKLFKQIAPCSGRIGFFNPENLTAKLIDKIEAEEK